MSLEYKKMEVEYMRVKTARMEIEYKIEERKDEIKRLEDYAQTQLEKEAELAEKLKDLRK